MGQRKYRNKFNRQTNAAALEQCGEDFQPEEDVKVKLGALALHVEKQQHRETNSVTYCARDGCCWYDDRPMRGKEAWEAWQGLPAVVGTLHTWPPVSRVRVRVRVRVKHIRPLHTITHASEEMMRISKWVRVRVRVRVKHIRPMCAN